MVRVLDIVPLRFGKGEVKEVPCMEGCIRVITPKGDVRLNV